MITHDFVGATTIALDSIGATRILAVVVSAGMAVEMMGREV